MPTSWNDAERLAAKRTIKDMNGYLAKVTSNDEHDFLERAFVAPLARIIYEPSPVSVWLGGQKSSLTNAWLWATGPELGEAFYGKGVDGFSDWADGEPAESESAAGYLSWVIGSNATITYNAYRLGQDHEEAKEAGSWYADLDDLFRRPHFAVRWMKVDGQKRPFLRPIRGSIVNRKLLSEVPTAYVEYPDESVGP